MNSSTNSKIKSIDNLSKHKIQSGQVVFDLQGAVKELVENSLDAHSTVIEIRFKDYGLESLQVIDNGVGIPSHSFESIAMKHHTSKLSSFNDLGQVKTFGFRGEALSSLCALTDFVECITATEDTAPKGNKIQFDNQGKLKEVQNTIARQRGTTITLGKLFNALPVRRKELEKNHKREYSKAIALLQSYALVPVTRKNEGVRLIVSNTPKSGRKNVVIQTSGKGTLPSAISSIFGPRANEGLTPLSLTLLVKSDPSTAKREGFIESELMVKVEGIITKPLLGHGRNSNDRQYFYINGRPCNMPKVGRAINEIFKSYNISTYPFVIADFQLPTDSYDVNVSPDKRTIFLHFESTLIDSLKEKLIEFFEPFRGVFSVNGPSQLSIKQSQATKLLLQESSDKNVEDQYLVNNAENDVENDVENGIVNDSKQLTNTSSSVPPLLDNENDIDRAKENAGNLDRDKIIDKRPNEPTESKSMNIRKTLPSTSSTLINTRQASWASEVFSDEDITENQPSLKRRKTNVTMVNIDDSIDNDKVGNKPDSKDDTIIQQTNDDQTEDSNESQFSRNKPSEKYLKYREDDTEKETPIQHSQQSTSINDIIDIDDDSDIDNTSEFQNKSVSFKKTLDVNIEELKYNWNNLFKLNIETESNHKEKIYNEDEDAFEDAGLNNIDDEQLAEKALSRILHKDDFNELKILGQFNLGFIIVRRDAKSEGNDQIDLFIVDQHAADEKFNFENLQSNHKIQSQRLIRPRQLDLSASDELTVMDNIDILKKNGFDLSVDVDAASGCRCRLEALPISKSVIFDVGDIEELLHILRENPNKMARCSKATEMFASRACRMSVMIGKSLTMSQMTKIVRNLNSLNQPWNCPHGRPTLRHLANLPPIYTTMKENDNKNKHKIDWSSF